MSPEAAVSVPGKAILLGEHAAVYGHPALVTAVDLRLSVVARRSEAPGVAVSGVSEFHTGRLPFAEVVALCRGEGAPGDRLAYLAAGAALLDAAAAPDAGVEITVASEIPAGSGLGSSAALSVGVVAAVLTVVGAPPDGARIARIARTVETRQHGRPSGVDVEAVRRGGTLWCERTEEGTLACTALAPPGRGLARLELYHTGTPAESTGEMVAAVARRLEADPRGAGAAMEVIAAATREARGVLAGPDGDAPLLTLIARAEAALESLGVVPHPVAAAIRRIEEAGGAAKVSGAGGRTGGAGLVLVLPPEAGAPVPSDWTRLRCALGAPGLREDVAA